MFTTFDIVMTILVSAGLAFMFGRIWQGVINNPIIDRRLHEDVEITGRYTKCLEQMREYGFTHKKEDRYAIVSGSPSEWMERRMTLNDSRQPDTSNHVMD